MGGADDNIMTYYIEMNPYAKFGAFVRCVTKKILKPPYYVTCYNNYYNSIGDKVTSQK